MMRYTKGNGFETVFGRPEYTNHRHNGKLKPIDHWVDKDSNIYSILAFFGQDKEFKAVLFYENEELVHE